MPYLGVKDRDDEQEGADLARADVPAFMSIGHSTHPIEGFIDLLRLHGVDSVVDVRSSPFSRFNPQFNRHSLERDLRSAGIGYRFMGEALGGKPDRDEFYDLEGYVLYGRMAESPSFEAGMALLCERARRARPAIMCSEEDPALCHRFLLITRVLYVRGTAVTHIRGDGGTQCTEDVRSFRDWSDPVSEEVSLLDGSIRSSWRSNRPVRRRGSV